MAPLFSLGLAGGLAISRASGRGGVAPRSVSFVYLHLTHAHAYAHTRQLTRVAQARIDVDGGDAGPSLRGAPVRARRPRHSYRARQHPHAARRLLRAARQLQRAPPPL